MRYEVGFGVIFLHLCPFFPTVYHTYTLEVFFTISKFWSYDRWRYNHVTWPKILLLLKLCEEVFRKSQGTMFYKGHYAPLSGAIRDKLRYFTPSFGSKMDVNLSKHAWYWPQWKENAIHIFISGLSVYIYLFLDLFRWFFPQYLKLMHFTPGFGPKRATNLHRHSQYKLYWNDNTLYIFVIALSLNIYLFLDLFRWLFPEIP